MRNGTRLLGVVAASVASVGLASPALAQDRPMYELPAIEVGVLQDALHQQAIALYESPERWAEAARLHRAAAEALPRNDAGQYFGFDRAARLFFYAGDFRGSRRSMETAARVAEAIGDVLIAAHAWVDAAFIAVHEGFPAKKREFVAEARLLADSDLLTGAERDGIVARIDGTRGGPQAARYALGQRWGSPAAMAAADR